MLNRCSERKIYIGDAMDFFFFPEDYSSFTMFVNWLFNQALGIVFLVWVMNFVFSVLQRITHFLSHNGGKL